MKEHLLIVVIEDNDALREATIDMLHHNGFRAMGVACAEDIDDTPFPQPPDIFVVDLNLPGEDGLSLATRLRKAQPKVGIVITTARTLLNDRLKGYESGADIYLPKPVDPKELVLALQALGQRLLPSVSPPPGLVMNKHNHTLEGPAGHCKLSDSETRLLLAFASAKEQTLERWQVATQMSPGNDTLTQDSTQAREQLKTLMDRAVDDREVVLVRRRSGGAVAMIAADELQSLMETAHLLRSPKNAERLLAALARARAGDVAPTAVDALEKHYGLQA